MIIQLSVNNDKNEEVKWQTFYQQYFDNNKKKSIIYLLEYRSSINCMEFQQGSSSGCILDNIA